MNLTKYEQETIINFNAGEKNATVFTLDSTVMRQLDSLVNEYPDTFRCIKETDISGDHKCSEFNKIQSCSLATTNK